jgi:hypothetical protein
MLIAAAVVGAAVLGAQALSPAPAQAAPKAGERVAIKGCPSPGATANCLMLKGSDGAVYDISSISPRPRSVGRMIWLRGTVSDKRGICAQGQVLDRIRWTRVREPCPN